jgi:hypothetical protein
VPCQPPHYPLTIPKKPLPRQGQYTQDIQVKTRFFKAANEMARTITRPGHAGLVRAQKDYGVNEEPQPQVVVALGLRITNCAPSRSSL